MNKLFEKIKANQIILFIIDLIVVNGSYFLSLFLHRQFSFDWNLAKFLGCRIPFVTIIYISLFIFKKLYSNMWKYMGFYELVNAVLCAGIGTALSFTVDYVGMKICQATDSFLYFNCMPFIVLMPTEKKQINIKAST